MTNFFTTGRVALLLLLSILILTGYLFLPDIKRIYTAHIMSNLPADIQEKIWVHRTNTIAKAQEAEVLFHGIELDVTFRENENLFDVNHPPLESIDLSLHEYLSSVNHKTLNFWIDLKNFRGTYNEKALQRLVAITSELGIERKRIIVESNYPHILGIYTRAGFKTSYYLPHRLLKTLNATPRSTYQKAEKRLLARLNRNILKGNFHYISFHSKYLDYVLNNMDKSKKILLWNQKLELFSPQEKQEILSLLRQDGRIEVILVKMDSKNSR